jgi:predicted DNA-binding protein
MLLIATITHGLDSMKQIRMAMTLPPELDEVITHIAEHQKRTKTSLVVEILLECLPALQGVSEAYKMIEKKQNPQAAMNAMVGKMMQKMGDFGKELEDHANSQLKKCPDTIEMDLKPE